MNITDLRRRQPRVRTPDPIAYAARRLTSLLLVPAAIVGGAVDGGHLGPDMEQVNRRDGVESVPEVDAELMGLLWVDGEQAILARWQDEPIIERFVSGVPPKRPAVGSVRRGPARPSGGGRVPGHGTEGRHLDGMRRYLADLVERSAEFQVVEIIGRGLAPDRLAASLRRVAAVRDEPLEVTLRRVARRLTERQMMARLRVLVGAELPRRSGGPCVTANLILVAGERFDTGSILETLGSQRGMLYYHLLLARLETRGEIGRTSDVAVEVDGPRDGNGD